MQKLGAQCQANSKYRMFCQRWRKEQILRYVVHALECLSMFHLRHRQQKSAAAVQMCSTSCLNIQAYPQKSVLHAVSKCKFPHRCEERLSFPEALIAGQTVSSVFSVHVSVHEGCCILPLSPQKHHHFACDKERACCAPCTMYIVTAGSSKRPVSHCLAKQPLGCLGHKGSSDRTSVISAWHANCACHGFRLAQSSSHW